MLHNSDSYLKVSNEELSKVNEIIGDMPINVDNEIKGKMLVAIFMNYTDYLIRERNMLFLDVKKEVLASVETFKNKYPYFTQYGYIQDLVEQLEIYRRKFIINRKKAIIKSFESFMITSADKIENEIIQSDLLSSIDSYVVPGDLDKSETTRVFEDKYLEDCINKCKQINLFDNIFLQL